MEPDRFKTKVHLSSHGELQSIQEPEEGAKTISDRVTINELSLRPRTINTYILFAGLDFVHLDWQA